MATCIVIPVTWPGTSGDGVVGTLSTTTTDWDAACSQAATFFTENSYSQFTYAFTRIAPVSISTPTATDNNARIGVIQPAADTAATSAGHSPAGFDVRAYILPNGVQFFTGTGGDTDTSPLSVGVNSSLWSAANFRSVAHELGHATGQIIGTDYGSNSPYYPLLPHSSFLQPANTSTSFDPAHVLMGNVVEYGNTFDIMGSTSNGGHFAARHKKALGWLSPTNVSANGTYALSPLEGSSGSRVIVIQDGTYTNVGGTWGAEW